MISDGTPMVHICSEDVARLTAAGFRFTYIEENLYAMSHAGRAAGAWPNGSPVVKQCSQRSDRHMDGSRGRILGSVGPEHGLPSVCYFVAWNDDPELPIFVVGHKLQMAGLPG